MQTNEVPTTVGYAHLDDKGRLTLGKAIRQALHLEAGSTVALVTVGEAVLLLPQDAHLVEIMEAARAAFERAHLSLNGIDAELEAIRDEVVREHYGAGFFEELQRTAGAPADQS